VGTNLWTFTLTLTEEAGFATTVTGLNINNVPFTAAQIQSLFGTTGIPANGQISGTYSLRGLNVTNGPVSVPFTISGGSGSATWSTTMSVPFAGPAPNSLAIGGASNAANGQQAFAPGMLVSVYGTGLGDFVQSAAAATISPLPEYLAGVSPYAYNLSSNSPTLFPSLLYVSPNQVNLQLPYELESGPAELAITSSWNSTGVTYDFTVSDAAPGIFSYASTSGGLSSPIGSGSTRAGSEVAIYVTGVGQVSPAPGPQGDSPDGFAPLPGTVPAPVLPVSITVGGVPVAQPFAYIGIPSWSVGVVQINFTIPSGVPAGSQPVVVTVGGFPSLPSNITITQ
jgi:uncharacterized protein (TIGR03437 family)